MKPYSSPLCSNCHRDKRVVAGAQGIALPDKAPAWRAHLYCFECVDKLCQDFCEDDLSQWQCRGVQIVINPGEHPAQYTGFCKIHYRERYTCHKFTCKNPKEPWREMCDTCRKKTEQRVSWAVRKQWHKAGVLCPDCERAPQHGPQRWCRACLVKRGMHPLPQAAGPWQAVVRAMAQARHKAGEPLDPHVRARQREATPKRAALPAPYTAPYQHERKWKRAYWTRLVPRPR